MFGVGTVKFAQVEAFLCSLKLINYRLWVAVMQLVELLIHRVRDPGSTLTLGAACVEFARPPVPPDAPVTSTSRRRASWEYSGCSGSSSH